MTVEEAQGIIDKTGSPYLKRDMEKFIKRQRRKDGAYGTTKKEIDQKQFEALCGLQCTLLEICDALDVSDKTLDGWCKRTYGEHFSEVFAKRGVKGKYHCEECSGGLLKRMRLWLSGSGNSTSIRKTLWSKTSTQSASR